MEHPSNEEALRVAPDQPESHSSLSSLNFRQTLYEYHEADWAHSLLQMNHVGARYYHPYQMPTAPAYTSAFLLPRSTHAFPPPSQPYIGIVSPYKEQIHYSTIVPEVAITTSSTRQATRKKTTTPRRTVTNDDRRRICTEAQRNPSMTQAQIGGTSTALCETISLAHTAEAKFHFDRRYVVQDL